MKLKNAKLSGIDHHIKGLRPALQTMAELGFSHDQCLEGTGINEQQLNNPDMGISLEQEFAFYRRLIQLSEDPLIGLKLGQAYRLESYGVLGYAILSSPTLGRGLELANQYGELSFSHFKVGFEIKGKLAHFQMHQVQALDADLLTLYESRDASAILAGILNTLGGEAFHVRQIKLMHDCEAEKSAYEALFNCPVSFNHSHLEIVFDASILKHPMPLRDADTAEYCRKQCEVLLKKASQAESWADLVQQTLRQGNMAELPNIKQVANSLKTSERTLRRKLSEEGYTFQALLNEVLYHQARTLLDSDLNLEQVANELGYSEAANFSHAFKRWAGMSPTQYRHSKS